MILYIHGFASSAKGGKAMVFREYFKNEVLAPSIPFIPALAIDTLEQLIKLLLKRGEKVGLVGSSLGGYISIYLATKYDLKAVLINPAIYPYTLLDKKGIVNSHFDNSKFELTKKHTFDMKNYEVQKEDLKQENFMTLLQTDDEVLDYNEAKDKLDKSHLFIEEGGKHSFEGIERYFEKIEKFLEK